MKKKTLLAPSLFLSGILLFSGCGSSATTSAVHQNKSADSWAVEASEPLDDSGFSYDGEADMMDDTATAETAGSSSDSSVSDAATDAAEATHDQSTRKLIRTVSMDIATEDLDTLRTKLDNSHHLLRWLYRILHPGYSTKRLQQTLLLRHCPDPFRQPG